MPGNKLEDSAALASAIEATSSPESAENPVVVIVQKPKRSLTAYNIFFQHERQKILAERMRNPSSLAAVPPRSRFGNMAKTIAAKWSIVDTDTKNHFLELARLDGIRYKKEMSEWKKLSKPQKEKKTKKKKTNPSSKNTAIRRSSSATRFHQDFITSKATEASTATATKLVSSSLGATKIITTVPSITKQDTFCSNGDLSVPVVSSASLDNQGSNSKINAQSEMSSPSSQPNEGFEGFHVLTVDPIDLTAPQAFDWTMPQFQPKNMSLDSALMTSTSTCHNNMMMLEQPNQLSSATTPSSASFGLYDQQMQKNTHNTSVTTYQQPQDSLLSLVPGAQRRTPSPVSCLPFPINEKVPINCDRSPSATMRILNQGISALAETLEDDCVDFFVDLFEDQPLPL